jgi:hypothetical protein
MVSPQHSNHATLSAPNFSFLCKPHMEDQKKKLILCGRFGPSGKRAGIHVPFKNGNNLLDDSWF